MEENQRPRRGRPFLAAIAVAGAIAAVPAGVALAGDSGGSGEPSGSEAQSGRTIQSTQPDRDGDRRDCPKDRQGNEATQL
jgi:hypothetical protein